MHAAAPDFFRRSSRGKAATKTHSRVMLLAAGVLSAVNMRGRRSVLDRPLPMRSRNEVGLSAFGFLFSEFIQYSQQRVNTAEELEHK